MNFDAKIAHKPSFWENDRLYFFKYMSAGTAKIVLKNRTLRWSTPSQLNDPFDIQFNMDIRADPATLKVIALDRLWDVFEGRTRPNPRNPLGALFSVLGARGIKISKEDLLERIGPAYDEGFARMMAVLPSVHEEASAIISSVKILCMSARPDNTLMWSHYAGNHSGVVLRFKSIPELDTPYGMAKPVNYVGEVPPLLSEEQLADIFAGTGSIYEAGILDRTVYTKSLDWAYEDEWRLSTGTGRNPNEPYEDCPFGGEEVDGVIFGLRTSGQEREEIAALLASFPKVELMEVRRTPSSFGLSIVTI
jgi:hypothetical protein